MAQLSSLQIDSIKLMRDQIRDASETERVLIFESIPLKLSQLDLDHDIRRVEDACTRIATSHVDIPSQALAIAENFEKFSDVERGYAAVIAGIGFRRFSNPIDSRKALEILGYIAVPWVDARAFQLHLESLTFTGGSPSDIYKGYEKSRKANELCPNNPGILHALGEFELERAIWAASTPDEQTNLLESALRSVNEALALEDWPKFHFTRARILLRKANSAEAFTEALSELDTAISLEVRASADSEERRSRYQYERLMAEMRADIGNVEKRFRAEFSLVAEQAKELINAEARRSQVQVVASVGFLTSLIALLQFAAALYVTAEAASDSAQVSFWYLVIATVVMAVLLFGSVITATLWLARSNNRA